MNEKVNKAYSILGVIKRNFIYMDKNTMSTHGNNKQTIIGTVNSSHDFRLWRVNHVTSWLAPDGVVNFLVVL